MEKKNLNEILNDVAKFFKAHQEPMKCDCDEEPCDLENLSDRFVSVVSQIKPAAVDILMEHEYNFLSAMKALVEKHKSLETVEQIAKLNEAILKLCK